MIQNIITAEFIEKFNVLDGKKVNVYIKHILYGLQKIRGCVPHILWDGERIGLIIDNEEKYIMTDELCEVYADYYGCYIKGNVMEIEVQLQ